MALGKTRQELLNEIDIYELEEWRAFWEIEGGFGDWKQDYRSGQICSVIANTNRNSKSKPKPFTPHDFALRPKMTDSKKDNSTVIIAGLDSIVAMNPKKGKK